MGRDRAIDIPQHYATGDERRRGVPGPVILLRSSTGDDLMSLQFGLALVVAWLAFAPPAPNAARIQTKEVEYREAAPSSRASSPGTTPWRASGQACSSCTSGGA